MDISLGLATPHTLGTCPAAIAIGQRSAMLLINTSRFDRLPHFAKRFVLAHELGHLVLSTSDERQADAFALGLLAGTEPCSLKKSLRTLLDLDIPPYRFDSLCHCALWRDRREQSVS